jgi:hypothetical protein
MEVPMVCARLGNLARSRVVAGLALTLTCLIVALSASSATAAAPPGVTVLNGDNKVLVVFKSAKCGRGSSKSPIGFSADANSRGWEMHVIFWRDTGQFTGFHTYFVGFGPGAAITVSVLAPDQTTFYSTQYAPPRHTPNAGAVHFGARGAAMSIGLYAVFTPDIQSGVALAGGLKCNYPRRRR